MKKHYISAPVRQKDIYIKGISGDKPKVPTDFVNLQEKAATKMSEEAYAYIAGGAGLEDTMKENRQVFNQWRIAPKMLKDVSERDISIELFGKKLPTPLLTCPIGVSEMVHKEADVAIAKATSSLNIPMIFSNQASKSMEECAAVMGDAPRWFQLYWSKSNDLVASLVERAEKCGCDAIAITLDTTILGWRPRDLNLAYLPFLKAKGIAQYTSDPVFNKMLENPEEADVIKPRLTWDTIEHIMQVRSKKLGSVKDSLDAIRLFTGIYSRPSLTWEDIPFIRQHTKLPILLKGIMRADDAKRAVDEGIDGIIVSNHGGRQVDGSISTLEALPNVVDAVNNQIPVLMDSGIRSGSDIFKALALGAKAVCIGRPYVYGLAIDGEAGVREVLQNMISDFELAMGLSGCKSIEEITRDMIMKR